MESLRRRLSSRRPLLGSWITLGHPAVPEIMGEAGFDFLVVDMEHSVIDLAAAQDLVRAIERRGIAPLVRVGENDPNLIKRVMDAGAHGVIVALVNSAEEARAAVGAVRYPPLGTRGVGLARAQRYGYGFEEYKRWLGKESVVLVLIEHIRAVENLESILAVAGLDGTLIGPYDLSASLGHPGEFGRPEVRRALEVYESACRRLKKPMGFHVVQPDPALVAEKRRRGYSFLAVGLDALFLGSKCVEVVSKVREGL